MNTTGTHSLPIGATVDMTVDAAMIWNEEPEVVLEQGTRYRFEVVGQPIDWRDASIATDPGGYSTWWLAPFVPLRRHVSARWFELIGAIDRKHAFRIGWGTELVAPASGRFGCFANDVSFQYRNNHGRLTLRITRGA